MKPKPKFKPTKQEECDFCKLEAFFMAYDAWMQSPNDACGDLFDAMMEAREEIEHLFPVTEPEDENVISGAV